MIKRLLRASLTFLVVAVVIFGGMLFLSNQPPLEFIKSKWIYLVIGFIVIVGLELKNENDQDKRDKK